MTTEDKRETCLKRFEPGETLLDFDEKALPHFFVLKQGALEGLFRDGRVVEIDKPDTYLAALFSFLKDNPSFVRLTAKIPSDVYLYPADMAALVEISPEVADTLVRKLLRLVQRREKELDGLRKKE